MPKLIFKQPDGTEKSIEAENGLSLMEWRGREDGFRCRGIWFRG